VATKFQSQLLWGEIGAAFRALKDHLAIPMGPPMSKLFAPREYGHHQPPPPFAILTLLGGSIEFPICGTPFRPLCVHTYLVGKAGCLSLLLLAAGRRKIQSDTRTDEVNKIVNP
jgi:hypothetical protein